MTDEYVDDGYSGTNFDRPSFQRMISDIDDEIDSATQQDNDFTPFLNIINEWYAKDTSKKIKAALRTKFQEGVSFCTYAPFGYKKDPSDHTKLIIDEETAPIIRHIFDLALQGNGTGKIVKSLISEQIPTPSWYNYTRYGTFSKVYEESEDKKYIWSYAQVKAILRNEVYMGNMVHNKRSTVSFKNKKLKRKKASEWIRVENTHEPIISHDDFCKVQDKRIENRSQKSDYRISSRCIS